MVELFGPESSGKTTIALHAVAQAQQNGGVAAFVDVEHALDPAWCKRLGVDIEALLVSQPGSAEEALQIAEMLVLSNAVDIIVIDSVAALVPRAEIEGEIGDTFVGVQARLMSQALRKLTGGVSRSKCVLIFINQIREKIGVMFGSPETTPGGPFAPQILQLLPDRRQAYRSRQRLRRGGRRLAHQAKVVKNKVAPPFRVCGVRHDVQPRHLARGGPAQTWPSLFSSSTSPARGSTTETSGSDKGGQKHQAVSARQPERTWLTKLASRFCPRESHGFGCECRRQWSGG